ncbi:MAG: OsmC family protein [Bacteroidota bacterium]
MKITTNYLSDFEYQSTAETGETLKIDMKPEGKTEMAPMQMVLSALSGCIAVEVALMIQKKRRTLIDLVIEAEGKRRDQEPKSFTDLHLKFILTSPDATEDELNKVAKLGLDKYCSVADSLKPEISFECEIRR